MSERADGRPARGPGPATPSDASAAADRAQHAIQPPTAARLPDRPDPQVADPSQPLASTAAIGRTAAPSSHGGAPSAPGAGGRTRRRGDAVFRTGTGLVGVLVLLIFSGLILVLLRDAWPAFRGFGPRFLVTEAWDGPNQRFGALAFIHGTLLTSLLALLLAVPVAVGTAIALTQLLPRWLANPVGLVVELLAAVPSIVYGVWGFAVVAPFVRDLAPEGRTFGPSILAAGFVLAVMVVPIVTAISRDMLQAVPRHQRDAALALGATPWEVTWRVLLPNARAGITAASLLGLGRALGETMAVIMVVGNVPLVAGSVFDSGSTIASIIANDFGDPSGPLHRSSLFALALILLAMSLAVSLLARLVVRRWGRNEVA
ncbi:MAG TPA: phosphate ABC transporter permease subunit PstC [Candidatus Thermoplasmatota archaeon]|nr:phosphate ABC transporter permease subunit PstC [Candidatus Thermoplasmatota archaeon]